MLHGWTLVGNGWGWIIAILVCAAGALIYWRQRTQQDPAILYSQVEDITMEQVSWLVRLRPWVQRLFFAAVGLLALALLDVRIQYSTAQGDPTSQNKRFTPVAGAAIYLVLDRSGSMRRKVLIDPGEGLPRQETRLAFLKEVTAQFIEGNSAQGLAGHANDLLGLVTFARAATIVAPLTLDHEALLRRLKQIQAVDDPLEDGTGIGYAIYKTVSSLVATRHFGETLAVDQRPPYSIEETALLVVTDGFQSPNPLDEGDWLRSMGLEDAAAYARENGVKLFLVSIEPVILEEKFAPFRHLMQRVAESTGGGFFIADSPSALTEIYQQVDRLERSRLPAVSPTRARAEEHYRQFPLYQWFMALGMLFLGSAVLLETLIIRPAP